MEKLKEKRNLDSLQIFLKCNSVWKREERKTHFQCDPVWMGNNGCV